MPKKEEKELESVLRKIERAVIKTKKKLGRFDLDYTVQVTINGTKPKHVSYAAQLTPPADHLAPITFISHTGPEDLLVQIEAFLKDVDQERVEIAYHEAQIVACENTITAHREIIEKIKNKDEESKESGDGEQSEQSEQPTED